ncbi:MAG: transposase [Pyrinomonadaceae bacterium]|nr:transposase [Pyrinomonadaceae bacterium]
MNEYGTKRIPQRDHRREYNRSIMSREQVYLDGARRKSVENAIREVCQHRNWRLLAINVRTNHFHTVVVTPGLKPDRALNAFKSYATRNMRKSGCYSDTKTPWVDKGSERWLWNEISVANACD